MSGLVTLIADAGPTIGAGHVMRTLTLAAAIQERGAQAALASKDLPETLRSRAGQLGVRVIDRKRGPSDDAIVDEVLASGCGVVVIDTYDASSDVMDELTARVPVLILDDERTGPLGRPAAVLNQNLHADAASYADLDPDTQLLIGPRWALIREEVLDLRGSHQREPETVLIALGGADVRGLTGYLARACEAAGSIPITAAGLVNGRPEGESDPSRFARALATCEIAVVGAGTTVWECLCLGTPTIALVTADNQLAIATAGLAAGVLGASFDARGKAPVAAIASEVRRLSLDGRRRQDLALVGPTMVDGEGAARVASAVVGLLS